MTRNRIILSGRWWHRVGLLVLLVSLAVPVMAQPPETLTLTGSAEPATAFVGETPIQVQLDIQGDSSLCPVVETTRPVDVALVVDVSGSMDGEKIEQARLAGVEFLRNVDFSINPERGGDQVGLVVFGDGAAILQSLTQDFSSLEQNIRSLAPGGSTDMAAGLDAGMRVVNDPSTENTVQNAAPVIVLLSDGEPDNASGAMAAANAAKSTGARIVTVGLGDGTDANFLRQIASRPGDYYEAPNPVDLPLIYQQIAQNIVPQTAATDVEIAFRYNRDLFELIPNSTTPPAVIEGDTLRWVIGKVENIDDPQFSFEVRALQVGTAEIGQVIESSYAPCLEETRLPLPNISVVTDAQLPPPTATPTPQPTPLPTATPAPPTPVPSTDGDVNAPNQPVQMGLGLLAYCQEGFDLLPWGTLLLLALLALAFMWWLSNRMNNQPESQRPSIPCFLSRAGLFAWFLFALWVFTLPFYIDSCPKRDTVYFWQQDVAVEETGLFTTPYQANLPSSMDTINSNGCVGCHVTSQAGNRIAAIRGPAQDSRLLVYNTDGSPVRLGTGGIRANFVSLSPDGSQAVIADPDGDLSLVSIADGTTTKLQGASDPSIVETMPSWGPDGRIAFVRADDPNMILDDGTVIQTPTDIYTISATGGQATPLAGASDNGAFNYYPSYSPDAGSGAWIAFTRHTNQDTYADPQAEIWLVPATGGEARPVAANFDETGNPIPGATNSWPSWSRTIDPLLLSFNTKRDDPGNFDIFYTEVNPQTGDTGSAQPLPGASSPGVFQHTAAWGPAPDLLDPVAAALALWPFGLPLIPLMLLAWLLCRREPEQYIETGDISGSVYEMQDKPVPPKLEKLAIHWEPNPALVIGLGETGRWTLTHLKKNLLDAGDNNLSDNVRLLLVDTGDYTRLKQIDETNAVTFAGVELSPDEMLELRQNLLPRLQKEDMQSQPPFRHWLQQGRVRDLGSALDLERGAQQQRTVARLGMIHQMQTMDDNLWTRLRAVLPAVVDNNTVRIIIVGDTYDDVSSALIADVAILAREAAGLELSTPNFDISLYLATRDRRNDDFGRLNSVQTLRELRRFQLSRSMPYRVPYGEVIDGLDNSGEPLTRDLSVTIQERLFNTFTVYDADELTGDASAYRNTLYPMMSDSILMRMDKGYERGEMDEFRQTTRDNLEERLRQNEMLYLATERVLQYRLPFVDLIAYLRVRFIQEVLTRFGPETNPYIIGSVADPVEVARMMLNAKLDIEPRPVPLLRVLNVALQDNPSEDAFNSALSNAGVDNSDAVAAVLRRRLVGTLQLILNGDNNTREAGQARAGKLRRALEFLAVLPQVIQQAQDVLEYAATGDDSSRARIAARINTALDDLTTFTEEMQQQFEAIDSALMDEEDSLLTRVGLDMTDINARRDEMSQIKTRRYIWENSNGQPLVDAWYDQFLFPNVMKTVSLFYWDITETGRVNLTFASIEGQRQLELSRVDKLRDWLFDIASGYCQAIRREQSLDVLLKERGLPQNTPLLEEITSTLYPTSSGLLRYDRTEARNSSYDIVIGRNEIDVAEDILQTIQQRGNISSANQLHRMNATDPFGLVVKQREALIPLDAVTQSEGTTFYNMWQTYLKRMGYTQPGTASNLPLLAVHSAEAYARRQETRFPDVLNTQGRILHPMVILGLTDPDRAEMFLLALASGELEVQGPLPGTANEYDVTLLWEPDDYAIETPPQYQIEDLHPVLQAYLTFVYDPAGEFPDTLLSRQNTRYKDDAYLPDIWAGWIDGGYSIWLDDVDDYNQPILRDLLDLSRLVATDFSRRYND